MYVRLEQAGILEGFGTDDSAVPYTDIRILRDDVITLGRIRFTATLMPPGGKVAIKAIHRSTSSGISSMTDFQYT